MVPVIDLAPFTTGDETNRRAVATAVSSSPPNRNCLLQNSPRAI